jgi:starch synthase (maltosyl-transferring)
MHTPAGTRCFNVRGFTFVPHRNTCRELFVFASVEISLRQNPRLVNMHQPQRLLAAAATSPVANQSERFAIEDIYPSLDGGRFPVKRIAGDKVEVWADIFREGHEVISAALRWRRHDQETWNFAPMKFHGNDRWRAWFMPPGAGRYFYAIGAWTDRFGTWRRDYQLKSKAGEDVTAEFLSARQMLDDAIAENPAHANLLRTVAEAFDRSGDDAILLTEDLAAAMHDLQPRPDEIWSQEFPLLVERPAALAGAWYEIFPRSQGKVGGGHGTFRDCMERVPEIAALGFDVLYMPPIHPIGMKNRKGKNNAPKAEPGDPGSPYAIGSELGGHDAVHPELGTVDDFRRLVEVCAAYGMEVALDFAVQCSPDHPWIKEHPDWFQWQPDKTIKYAENPPKKYQDIVNPDLWCANRAELWAALRDVVLFWHSLGVRIFRVDNPHTKAFAFWEWLIAEVQKRDAGVIFLSEAFTRPKVMKALAKLGFSQSYTYFTWRTNKQELTEYLSEITGYPEREYFRPNFFVNTPDILPFHLQSGEPWMFKSRVALAATLSSNYGVYSGFELLEHEPLPGKEEYLDSEKYEIKPRDWNKPGNIKDYIARLNQLRRANRALLQTQDLRFLQIDNDGVIGFIKESRGKDNAVAVAIALAPGRREFWLHFGDLHIGSAEKRQPVRTIENLVTGEQHRLEWGGVRLSIDAERDPALLFRCR